MKIEVPITTEQPESIAETVRKFVDARNLKKEVERQYDSLKPLVEKYLRDQPGRKAEVAGFKLTLRRQARTMVSNEAILKLGRKLLKPFIKISRYWVVDVA